MTSTAASKVITLDCSIPSKDNIVDVAELTQFFYNKIKVAGKTGNFEKRDSSGKITKLVVVSNEGDIIKVESQVPMKNRYIKYLTKMYFNSVLLRDYLRVLTNGKNNYIVRYFKKDLGVVSA